MVRIALPSFSQQQVTSADMRQLVSALELRFQSLETTQENFFPSAEDSTLDARYATAVHTHTISDITDLPTIPQSIYDLIDVTGSAAIGETLIWNGTAYAPGTLGGAFDLNDLNDVNAAGPTDQQALVWNAATLRWIPGTPASAGAGTLFDLTDTDIAAQTQHDLIFNANGSEWRPTGPDFQWIPSSNLQLGNTIGINWIDGSFASTELLVLNDSLTTGPAVTYDVVSAYTTDTSVNGTYSTPTGMSIDQTNLVDGDQYLVIAKANISSSDTSGTHLFFKVIDHAGATLDMLPAQNESEGGGPNGGFLHQHASVFTASHGGTGLLEMQIAVNSSTPQANFMEMFVMSLTELGASNWAYDYDGTLDTGPTNFIGLGVSATVGNGTDDWLFIASIKTNSAGGAYNGAITLSIGGVEQEIMALGFRGDPGEQQTHTIQWVEEALPASTTVEVMGRTGGSLGRINAANIIAINLSVFAQHEIAVTDTPAIPTADVEYDLETLSFTSATATSDWAFIGAIASFPFVSGVGGSTGRGEIQVDVDGGGDQLTTWSNGYGQNTLHTYAAAPNENGLTRVMWPNALPSIANGASVVADLRYDPTSPTAYQNNGLRQSFLIAFPMRLGETGANLFTVGDDTVSTVIDGASVNISSAATDIDGTLNVDGTSTFLDDVDVTGVLESDKMIAGDPGTEGTGITVNGTNYESELKVSDIGAVNAAEFILHRHSTTLPALMIGARAKTDDATHAVMADNDVLMTFLAAGWDGVDSYSLSSEIRMEVDGTPGQDDMPGQITFMTSADGTETPVERMRIRSAGNVEMDNGLDVTGNITVTGTVDGIDIFTDVTANNAKVTNATHTGEVTGATTLTVDPLAITNKTDVVADAADDALISDDDDAGNLKKVNLSSITDGGFF